MRPFLFFYTVPPAHNINVYYFLPTLYNNNYKVDGDDRIYLFRDELNNLFLREVALNLSCHVSHWILSCFFIRKPNRRKLYVVLMFKRKKNIQRKT